jgi:hypothetical protein
MAETSLKYQIQRVSDLKQYLETSTILIDKLKYEMQTKIPYLTEHGLPVEIATKYESHYLSNLYMNMDKLKNRILTNDTAYLNDVILHLTNATNR